MAALTEGASWYCESTRSKAVGSVKVRFCAIRHLPSARSLVEPERLGLFLAPWLAGVCGGDSLVLVLARRAEGACRDAAAGVEVETCGSCIVGTDGPNGACCTS